MMANIYTQSGIQQFLTFYEQAERRRVNRILLTEILRKLQNTHADNLQPQEVDLLLKVCAYLKYIVQIETEYNYGLLSKTLETLEDVFECTGILQALADYEKQTAYNASVKEC